MAYIGIVDVWQIETNHFTPTLMGNFIHCMEFASTTGSHTLTNCLHLAVNFHPILNHTQHKGHPWNLEILSYIAGGLKKLRFNNWKIHGTLLKWSYNQGNDLK